MLLETKSTESSLAMPIVALQSIVSAPSQATVVVPEIDLIVYLLVFQTAVGRVQVVVPVTK